MNPITFYGIGVGPGDPELLTLKAANILKSVKNIIAPIPKNGSKSLALDIARSHLRSDAVVHTLVFPMVSDTLALDRHWSEAGQKAQEILAAGNDVCFLTLGDPLLYSTYIYLLRALKKRMPNLDCQTIPGITAASAVAARTNFPIGEGKATVTIVPTADDPTDLIQALDRPGSVVLMKIGNRLSDILDILARRNLLQHGVLVSRAGQAGEQIETDLTRLLHSDTKIGYMATMIIHVEQEGKP